jgi:thioredoxin 1
MTESIPSATDQDFADTVQSAPTPLLVDFWAPWCGPCTQLAPVVESIQTDLGDSIRVVKVNIDENPSLATEYNVSGVPTLVLFKEGQPVHRIQGARPKAVILAAIERYF